MHSYHLSQWVLFFFLYSFVGWIWESCYVSVRERKWVNRGFMHGPMLPIYGSGAVVVLISTIGVRENPGLIFLKGMTGATVLEYITGAVMERIFHVRYWDYSTQKFNLNGYICLSSSLCWGCFSVLLVRVIHVPVEDFVLRIPAQVSEWLSLILSVAAAVDLTQSFNEAMDMKRILVQLEASREQMRQMQEKLKAASEELADEYRQRAEEFREESRQRAEDLREGSRQKVEEIMEGYRQRSAAFAEEYRRRAEEKAEERSSRKKAYLGQIHIRREAYMHQLMLLADRAEKLLHEELPARADELKSGGHRRRDLESVKQTVLTELQKLGERTDRSYLRAARQLRRNPTAVSRKFKEALEELRRSMDNQ